MECQEDTCGNKFSKSYSCSQCKLKFCSNSCMIDHFFLKHETDSNDTTNIKNNPNNLNHKFRILDLKNTTTEKAMTELNYRLKNMINENANLKENILSAYMNFKDTVENAITENFYVKISIKKEQQVIKGKFNIMPIQKMLVQF